MGAIANGLALSRSLRPYVRHLPDLLRLHASGDPPGRADGPAGRSTSLPTTRSSSARTGRPTSRSSSCAALRAIPGLVVIRPADAAETVAAWRVAIERRDGPTALALTRQKLPVLAEIGERASAGVGARRLRRRGSAAGRARPGAPRDRLRGRRGNRRRAPAGRGGDRRAGRLDAQLRALRGRRRGLSRSRCCRPTGRRGSRSRRRRRSAGTGGSARGRESSA